MKTKKSAVKEKVRGRGMLDERVQAASKLFFGREISTEELRLIPYIHYVMTNERRLDPNRVNWEERKILRVWKDEGHIEGGASGLSITKPFWDYMCEVLFYSYVDY